MTKVSVRFSLKKLDATKATPIRCRICYANQRLTYYTGESILPEFWDNTTRRPRNTREFAHYLELKTRLNQIEKLVPKVLLDYQNERGDVIPSTDAIKTLLDLHLKTKEDAPADEDHPSFLQWVERFIADIKSGARCIPKTGKRYSVGSIKNISSVFKTLTTFEKTQRVRIEFEDVDLHLYQKLIAYLNRQGSATNHKGNVIKYVKVFMKQSMKDGLHTNIKFQDSEFVKPSEEVESIYLNHEELNRLFELDLSGTPGLDRVRDLFLVGCNTGLRYSDLSQVRSSNITTNDTGGQILRVRAQKTNKPVYVPISHQLRAILDKYDGSAPPTISNQKANNYLKEIARRAGIDDPVETTRNKGGRRVTVNRQKWEEVTTHTARRSFATNAYKNGVSTLDIMKLTGHKTETSFMKYIKISEEETATRLLDHPFFRQSSAIRIAQ
ncbi:tyrosine-type recombinase/integrase [Persicitalea sp.]|uniref:site-specific integrase n=1 Tax=Persicitalea sp. TaxID=3100273 RepID=UPI003592FFA1